MFGALGMVQKICTVLGRVGNQRTNYNSVEIGQNTETSSGDLRRLAITYTPVNDHQQTLV